MTWKDLQFQEQAVLTSRPIQLDTLHLKCSVPFMHLSDSYMSSRSQVKSQFLHHLLWERWLHSHGGGDQSHMSLVRSSVHAKWIMGKVFGTKMQKTAKARVTTPVLDPYLLKYYNKWKTSFVHDGLWQCTAGDIVLLGALPVR
ncbi:hypothetical protein H8959_002077 [Pygathrix nigripes]